VQKTSFDDSFVPVKLEGVECVEVISEKSHRQFSLIHPKTSYLENIEVKDQFVWDCIDGQKKLGEIKQSYYQKFKVLPTQQLVEKMRQWHERGFLEGGGLKYRSKALSGGMGLHLPAFLLRVTLGQLSRMFMHSYVAILMLALGGAGLAFSAIKEHPFFIFDGFSNLSLLPLLLCLFAGAQLGNLLRMEFMLGALSPAPTYRGDRIFIGLWGIVPVLSLDLEGLRLKSREKRLAASWVNWSAPVLVAGVLSVLPQFLPLGEWQDFIYTASMGCLVDFVLHSCPFFKSRLMRVFDELGEGVSIKRLKSEYSRGRIAFLDKYSLAQEKAVQWSTIALVIWVVVGSSFLLFCSAQLAEALTEFVRLNLNLEGDKLEKVQWLLYLPVLLTFFLLLWKLVQPFVQRLMGMSFMRDERMVTSFQIGMFALIPLGGMFLPELLLQFGLVVGVIVVIVKVCSQLNREHWSFRVQAFLMVASFIALVLLSVVSSYREEGFYALAFLWCALAVIKVESLSPRTPGWWIKLTFVSMVCLAIITGVHVFLHFPMDERSLFALAASICFGTSIWMLGGLLGWQLLPMGFGLWSMFFGSCFISVSLYWGQIFFALGLILVGVSQIAWIKCRNKLMHRISHIVVCDPKNFRASLEGTLNGILALFVGKIMVRESGAHSKSDVLFLGEYERWLKRWMPRKMMKRIMHESIGAIPWEHRAHWCERLERFAMPKQTESFTKEVRLKLLKSQLMFRGFQSKELEVLADNLSLQTYRKGEQVTEVNESGHPYLEIVMSGQLRVQQRDQDDEEPKVLADLGKGEAVRTEDLFCDTPYDFDAIWMSDGLTIKLHRVNFLQWSLEHPGLLKKVLESMALSEMISKLSLFKDFSSSQMRLLMEKLKKIEVPAGHEVITQGLEGDEFFLLDQGEVDVVISGNKVASLGAGSYFGEIALLQKCLRTATIKTSRASILYVLVQNDFERFFSSGRAAQVLENVSQKRGAS